MCFSNTCENVQKLINYTLVRNQSQHIPENQYHVDRVGRLQKEIDNNNKMNFFII